MKKILIVDYDQSSLASLQGVLAGQGYTVVTAADGQAGWDRYNKEGPDLVLMEAMLPKVHGFELCQRITSERNSQATVFIMTGVYKDRVYRTEALRTYGASEYFEKPLKMAELLASVEAVLGKPQPRPEEDVAAAEPPAPAREIRAEAAPAEPRKREKPRSDESLFTLPEDLNRLAREIPKMRKSAQASPAPSAEPRLEALADDLLKSVIVESKTPKPVQPKPGNGNGNGNGKAEIDQFLATALADLDLNKEKVKVPKTAPLPPPPVKEAPVPTPPPVAAKEPKPAPAPPRPPVPEPPVSRPAPADMKNTLTPGDPGSDVSPFFTPEKPKPAAPAEKPKVQPVAAPPVPAPAPKPAKPVEKTAKPAAPAAEPVRPAQAQPKPEPPRPQPAVQDVVKKEIQPTIGGDIFQGFHEEAKVEPRGFPKVVAIGIGVVALAAVGFVILRPKRPAPAPVVPQETTQTVTRSEAPDKPVEPPPAPVVKPAPAKQKAQPKAKAVEPEPAGADAILPNLTAAAAPPLSGGPGNALAGSSPAQAQGDGQQAKTEEAPETAVQTEAEKPQGTPAEAAAGGSDAETAAATPLVPPVNEGDLVELSAVTEVPKVIKSADPVYPQTAQRLGIGGSITVNALIDEKGNVIDTAIIKGIKDDKGLGRAAETAVRKWKFQPARKNGVAVKVWKSFVIAFRADANPANRTQ